MSKLIDITGEKYNSWTVLDRVLDNSKKGTYWRCQCECGTIKEVASTSLRNGASKSCGCQKAIKARTNNGKFIDETGNRYGKLVVLGRDEQLSIEKHRAQWICQCDCGNITTVSSKCLREDKTKSCGCLISIGEENISRILRDNNIIYKSQYQVNINGIYYRYDFAIFDKEDNLIRLIEFDGIQHYDDKQKHWGHDVIKTQERDKIKNQYALQNNIPLVRIPYIERDNITLEMLLGNEYLVERQGAISSQDSEV